MQIQADLSGLQIFRPEMVELTALGAAKLAARGAGLPRTDRGGETARMRVFNPNLTPAAREEMMGRWHTMVGRA
jgi:glycerol kinase